MRRVMFMAVLMGLTLGCTASTPEEAARRQTNLQLLCAAECTTASAITMEQCAKIEEKETTLRSACVEHVKTAAIACRMGCAEITVEVEEPSEN